MTSLLSILQSLFYSLPKQRAKDLEGAGDIAAFVQRWCWKKKNWNILTVTLSMKGGIIFSLNQDNQESWKIC